MRKRRSWLRDSEELEIDMTPMIDIVFQLIIFFMLVMDMTKVQIEKLTLPFASKAIKEKYEDPTLMVLNIMPDGTIKIQGRRYWRPDKPDDNTRIENLFETRRHNVIYQENPPKTDWVKYPLLIRAGSPGHHRMGPDRRDSVARLLLRLQGQGPAALVRAVGRGDGDRRAVQAHG